MRILVTGAGGMLAGDIARVFHDRNPVLASRASLDITDVTMVRQAVARADVVINCAGYTRVDDAETHRNEAFRINADGPGYLAQAAREAGSRLVHISTDYVFNGHGHAPYLENALRDPVNAYGESKAAGEEKVIAELPNAHYIVRTAWLYGQHGPNFPKTMLRLAQTHERWDVIDDQRGQPTWTLDVARQIRTLVESAAPPGIYHATNAGEASWCDFAREVLRTHGMDPSRVHPISTDQYPRPAARPAYSVLGHAGWVKAGLSPMRPWPEALAAAVTDGALG